MQETTNNIHEAWGKKKICELSCVFKDVLCPRAFLSLKIGRMLHWHWRLVIHIFISWFITFRTQKADEFSTLFSKTVVVSRVVEPKAVANLVEYVMHHRLTIKVDISTSYCGGFRSVRWLFFQYSQYKLWIFYRNKAKRREQLTRVHMHKTKRLLLYGLTTLAEFIYPEIAQEQFLGK